MGTGTRKAKKFQRLITDQSSKAERKMETQLPILKKKEGTTS